MTGRLLSAVEVAEPPRDPDQLQLAGAMAEAT
jgi:hypothetical protein